MGLRFICSALTICASLAWRAISCPSTTLARQRRRQPHTRPDRTQPHTCPDRIKPHGMVERRHRHVESG
eukprot:3378255-Rhodomonas_salina.1